MSTSSEKCAPDETTSRKTVEAWGGKSDLKEICNCYNDRPARNFIPDHDFEPAECTLQDNLENLRESE